VDFVEFDRAGLLAARRALRELAGVLRGSQPDLVHTHLLKADALGALAARKAGVAALVSSKHNDERALLRRPVGWVHGWLSRRVVATIALSDHVARFVAEHGRVDPARIRRIYYGVDATRLQPRRPRERVRAELGLDPDAPVLVCVGRLAPQKDHGTLLAGLARLVQHAGSGPAAGVQLLVVGGDPFGAGLERVEALVAEHGVGEHVRLLGIRDDVPDLLGASDLFVLTSLWEGLGLVFLEAMAVGLPVVATRVSAVPEVVSDGETGWLVPPGDPQALAAALAAALADPDERRRRGETGRRRLLERFALPRMMAEVQAVYDEVLEETRG
jgi:glycosyltransferase involved in cell wall biosynthesis